MYSDYPLDPLDAIAYQQHIDQLGQLRRDAIAQHQEQAEWDAFMATAFPPIRPSNPQQAQAATALDMLCQQAATQGLMDAYKGL